MLDKSKNLIKQLSVDDARKLIADGTISGGMIPKVETCIYALDQGVEGVVILDGKVPHAVLLELLTDHGAGTVSGAALSLRPPRGGPPKRTGKTLHFFRVAPGARIFARGGGLVVQGGWCFGICVVSRVPRTRARGERRERGGNLVFDLERP